MISMHKMGTRASPSRIRSDFTMGMFNRAKSISKIIIHEGGDGFGFKLDPILMESIDRSIRESHPSPLNRLP